MKSQLTMTMRARKRLDEIHSALAVRGFKRLAEGAFGLPSYDAVECWMLNTTMVYVVYRYDDGGFDILAPLVKSNRVIDGLNALDKRVEADKSPNEKRHCNDCDYEAPSEDFCDDCPAFPCPDCGSDNTSPIEPKKSVK